MHRYTAIILVAFVIIGCGGHNAQTESSPIPFDPEYSRYAQLLMTYVHNGHVDYRGLKTSRAGLDSLVGQIAGVDPQTMSDPEKMAFYINAYNILTLRSIIDAYPVESIRDIDGVWDKKSWIVAGEKQKLNDIEHEILRRQFADPRIHVAVNCASIGCPPLAGRPYYPETLDEQLTAAARNFVLRPEYNRLDPVAGTAQLSEIFDWYGEDFIPQYADSTNFGYLPPKQNATLHFIIVQHPDSVQNSLLAVEYTVSYLEYDWSLNEKQ